MPKKRPPTLADLIAGYTHDPLAFVKGVYPWGEGVLTGEAGPDAWQIEVLREIGAPGAGGRCGALWGG
jgi:hypothetical protein